MTLIQHWGMSLQVSDLITYLPHHRCVLQFGVSLLGCTDARMPEHLCHSLHAHAMVEEQHAACTAAPMRSDRLVYPRSLGDHFQPHVVLLVAEARQLSVLLPHYRQGFRQQHRAVFYACLVTSVLYHIAVAHLAHPVEVERHQV